MFTSAAPHIMVVLAIGMYLSSTARAADESVEKSQPDAVKAPVAVENVVEDEAIEERLGRILEARQRYANVSVHVDHGVVTFEGRAESTEDRDWVENLAERTQGVVAVDNRISVESGVNIDANVQVIRESLTTLWRDFLRRSPLMVAAAIVLIATAIFANVIGKLVTRILRKRRGIRSSLKDLIHQLLTIAIWVAGIVVAAVVLFPGLTPAKALTVLGLGSVAIGFAFKDIFENFFAGVLILWRYPFDRGDFITCENVTGRVEEITVRNTLIRRLDGELTVIPNATLFKSNVDVLTSRATRRVRILCGVAYGASIEAARDAILDGVKSCSTVKDNEKVEVFAHEFADSSINFEVAWWAGPTPVEIRASRDEVVEAIKSALDAAGIEIPFPHRTLTFREPLELSRSGTTKSNRELQSI